MAQAPALMQFLIVVLAAWLARQQEAFIEYLKAENRMLKARLGRRRIIFSDAERRLLARHAKAVGRKKLFELDPIVSPDTLLRWHRQLIAMKWTFRRQGPGRPRVMGTIEALVVRMASENPRWGYTRIQGALSRTSGCDLSARSVDDCQLIHGGFPFPFPVPVSGRKIPRDGGIILAVAKSRRDIEAIVKEDPFHAHGLADFRIIEFRASQRADDIQERIETS